VAWGPFDTRMPLGTAGLVGVPIQHKGLQVIAMGKLVLPTRGPKGRSDHIDLVLRCGHQEVGIDRAAVEPMGSRPEVSCRHILDDGRSHGTVGRGRRGREHLGNQIGVLRLTGLAEVQLIAHPLRVAFRAVAGLELIGRGEAHGRRRLLLGGAPADLYHCRDGTAIILLHPQLPQCLQGGKGSAIRRALGGPYLVQALIAICAKLAGEGFALTGVLRQARLVRPEAVARIPVQRHVLLPPGGGGGAELVERIMHGFQDTC